MYTYSDINQFIKDHKVDTNGISDGYHTFAELYEHRIVLFIELLKRKIHKLPVWKSIKQDEHMAQESWFVN